MSKHKIESVSYWKSAFVTLPDSSFFDIVRNYLGDVSTPFNKHKLFEKLVSFLKKEETIRRIISLIDTLDSQLLTAVQVLDAPTVDRLYAFLGGEESYLDLHHRLLNMEERLLVYRDHSDGEARIRINPILTKVLQSTVINPASVFPSVPCSPSTKHPWLTESLVLGFLAYALHHGSFLKADGSLRKKAANDLKEIIPPLIQARDRANRPMMVARALERLGILITEGNTFRVSRTAMDVFAGYDGNERTFRYWSAASQSVGSGSTEQRSACFRQFIDFLDPSCAYTHDTMWKIIFSMTGSKIIASREESDRFLSVLEALGIVHQPTKGLFAVCPVEMTDSIETRTIVQPNFEIRVENGTDLKPLLILPIAAEIRRSDVVSTFELTKESFVRALRSGLRSEEILDQLELMHGKPVPQNVRMTCTSWGAEYESVRLYSGIVLSVDETRRHLVEHGGFVDAWAREILSPGVYLLDPAEQELWKRDLEKAGIEAVPSVRTAGEKELGEPTAEKGAQIPHAERGAPSKTGKSRIMSRHTAPSMNVEDLDRSFIEELESKTSSLPVADREEMTARIRKKLVLFADQVRCGVAPREKNEARGIDYSGKVRLIEQALRTGTELLEIIERSTIGDPEKRLIKPEGLDQKATDLELIGVELPSGEKHRVRVRKIALLRKLKGSLYAP